GQERGNDESGHYGDSFDCPGAKDSEQGCLAHLYLQPVSDFPPPPCRVESCPAQPAHASYGRTGGGPPPERERASVWQPAGTHPAQVRTSALFSAENERRDRVSSCSCARFPIGSAFRWRAARR